MLRTTDRRTEATPASHVRPADTTAVPEHRYETQPPSGPGATRCLTHPRELTLRGIPVMCPACHARRDWLLLNHGRNVWIICRCGQQWLDPKSPEPTSTT